jgi:DNA-binding MarR family transcriptional regulator
MQEPCVIYAGNLHLSTTNEISRAVTLIAQFRRTSQLMVAELVERLASAGYSDITAAAHPLFENIDPGGTRLTELAARAGMTHQSMGELVDSLARGGYVERVADPSDGRARLVSLTARGRRVARDALREIAKIEARWTAAWRAAGLRVDLRAVLDAGLRQNRS